MDVRVSRASAVIVQRVPPAAADWFMKWQRDVTAAAENFAGFQGCEVYPATAGQSDEWVVVIHFADDETLRQWLGSETRAKWVSQLRAKVGEFDLKTLPGGFGAWFVGHGRPGDVPPSWKMVLTVLLGLYPTVMLLNIFVGPHTQPLGLAVSMLIGNALSVSLLQWVVMPALNAVLRPWLKANERRTWALSAGGVGVLLVVLTVLAVAFRQVTG